MYSPTEDVGTGTLEERLDTLGSDDLPAGVEHGLVVDLGTRGHHHTTTDGVKGVRSETGTGGNGPAQCEAGKEVACAVSKVSKRTRCAREVSRERDVGGGEDVKEKCRKTS